jgi:hypothetical protein
LIVEWRGGTRALRVAVAPASAEDACPSSAPGSVAALAGGLMTSCRCRHKTMLTTRRTLPGFGGGGRRELPIDPKCDPVGDPGFRHLIFHWHLVSEYGEDRDKQISYNRRVKGGRGTNTHRKGQIESLPRLHSLWHTGSIDVAAGCVCSRVPSTLTASASLDQPMMPDHYSACSHSQQTACNTLANTSAFTPRHQRTLAS